MPRLTKTNGGNWAKEITITAGGKWRFVGNFGSLAAAKAAAEIQRAKGRKVEVVECATSKTQEKKQRKLTHNWRDSLYVGPTEGHVFWRVEAYVSKTRQVMTHATAEDCAAVGASPGPCND